MMIYTPIYKITILLTSIIREVWIILLTFPNIVHDFFIAQPCNMIASCQDGVKQRYCKWCGNSEQQQCIDSRARQCLDGSQGSTTCTSSDGSKIKYNVICSNLLSPLQRNRNNSSLR